MDKMWSILRTVFIVLLLQKCVNTAPSELLSKLENISKVEQGEKPDSEPHTLVEEIKNNNNTTQQGQRQKRYFNYHGYGFPPMNPVIYPNYPSRDFPADYGSEDPFQHIYRRLQDIATVVRQPSLPPPPPPPLHQFPIFFPVIYIPQVGCACTPDQYVPPNQHVPTTPRPTDKNDTSDVDISNRFPDMEDSRQNWGFVINDTEVDDGQEEDFTRPISFVPIQPNGTMSRPPPPVEHGSSQGGMNQVQTPITTTSPPVASTPESRPPVPAAAPSACDAAVLSCCHQPEVTYDCFAVQGCPDPSSYGNPCEIQVILRVIDRFQIFYGQRNG